MARCWSIFILENFNFYNIFTFHLNKKEFMKAHKGTIFGFLLIFSNLLLGQVNFTKSNLPILKINTRGSEILDDPKINADLKIIDNGPGKENNINDAALGYDGKIQIELRGSTSQWFPKKPYGFETVDASGESNDVSLLGMPKENDWILNATYNDKSLMRDGLAYILAGSIMEYATRVRYTELTLNNQYQGIYLLLEKIKRDKNRVDIPKLEASDISGDDLTGGYIIKLDKETGNNSGLGWNSRYAPFVGSPNRPFFQYEYPKADDILNIQKTYIKNHIDNFENILAGPGYKDPVNGYKKLIDTKSLADFIIINEIAKNPDAYRLSTFFYKERESDGGKIKFGPVWDFNLGFGNVDYCTQGNTEGLVLLNFNQVCPDDGWVVHFWWKKFLEDKAFYDELKERWKMYRKNQFSDQRLTTVIDSLNNLLAQAQVRNFQKWPVLGEYIWPNYYVGQSHAEEVKYLKDWLLKRVKYLDKVWEIQDSSIIGKETLLSKVYPNPADDLLILTVNLKSRVPDIIFYNTVGQSFTLKSKIIGETEMHIDFSNLLPGLYIGKIALDDQIQTFKVVKN